MTTPSEDIADDVIPRMAVPLTQKQVVQEAIDNWTRGVEQLGPWERQEVKLCQQKLAAMIQEYHSSAELAIVMTSLQIGLKESK